MTMRVLPLLCALLLGVGTGLLAGCGGDRGNLLPQSDAKALKAQLQAVQQASSARRCGSTTEALDRARATVKDLPASVDDAVVERLLRGLDRLRTRADEECAASPEVTTTTITTTTTPAEPPPETTTQNTTPETTSSDTTPSTPSVPDTTTTDPGTGGGVTPDTGTTGTTPPEAGGASPTAPDPNGGLP
jgi:hypothetical protein